MHSLDILDRFHGMGPKFAIACCVFLGVFPLTIDAAPGETVPVSVGLPGFGANGASSNAKISGNGQFVIFESAAPDLVSGDQNGVTDVFVYNRLTRQTVRASVSTQGREGNRNSIAPSISQDGRFVAFESESDTLTDDPPASAPRIFVRDMLLGITRRIGSSPPGVPSLPGWSQAPSISSNGRFVAFHSNVRNLVSGDTGYYFDIFVYDMILGTTVRASLSNSGEEPYENSKHPSISSDGRYVAFTSDAYNLVPNDTNNRSDIFLRDLTQATTARVSVSSSGAQASHHSELSSISGDGRLICFTSRASNLVPGDNNSYLDAFVRDVILGTTRRVSLTSNGSQIGGGCLMATISEDGRYVGFTSWGSGIVSQNQNAYDDAYLRDLTLNSTSLISQNSTGQEGNQDSISISLSGDGRYASFASDSTNMSLEDRNLATDVFVRDRFSLETTLISNPLVLSHANDDSVDASVNVNGRFVAFTSEANNIVLGDSNNFSDVFVHDSLTGLRSWISLSSQGVVGNGTSRSPSISGTGRYVAFESSSSNWALNDLNNDADIFVRDTETDTTTLVSVSTSGRPGQGFSQSPAISADGRYVAFHSSVEDLVGGDSNQMVDVFVRDLYLGVTVRASVSTNGTQGNSWSQGPVELSADGRFVVFCSWANNLVPNDTNNARDVFVRDLSLGTTVRANLSSGGEQAQGTSGQPSISSTGRYVAFSSEAPNFFNNPYLYYGVFVRDLEAQTTTLVSVTPHQTVELGHSGSPDISTDGRFVAFYSESGGMIPYQTGPWGVLVRDLYLNMTYACNVNLMGEQGNDSALAPAISGDGRFVAFESSASNLTSLPKSRGFKDVFSHEVAPPLALELTFRDWLGGQPPTRVQYQVTSTQGSELSTGTAVFVSGTLTKVPRPPFGEYVLTVRAPRFLLRKRHFIQSGDTSHLGLLTLTNGDVDGSGEVDAADIDIVISRLGTTVTSANWLDTADLNGSGEVDVADIDISIRSFGAVGD